MFLIKIITTSPLSLPHIITTKLYSAKLELSRFESIRTLLLFSIALTHYNKFIELQLFVTDLKISLHPLSKSEFSKSKVEINEK